MYDSNRRLITIILFLLLGPLLTIALSAGLLLRSLPLSARWEERQIAAQTPWTVQIEQVEHLNPSTRRYKQFSILQSQTRIPLVVCPEIELVQKGPKWSCEITELFVNLEPIGQLDMFREFNRILFELFQDQFGGVARTFTFTIENIEITAPFSYQQADSFPQTSSVPQTSSFQQIGKEADSGDRADLNRGVDLGRSIDLGQTVDSNRMISLDGSGVTTISGSSQKFRLTFLNGTFTSTPEKDLLECSFNMSDNLTAEPIELRIEKTRNVADSQQRPQLNLLYSTVQTYSSGRFLTLLFPDLIPLGPDCRFSGRIYAEFMPEQKMQVKLEEMNITGIDLALLAPTLTPYHVSGLFTIGIKEAMLEFSRTDNRLHYAKGWGEIKDGTLQKELLVKLIDQFALSWTPTETATNTGYSPLERVRPNSPIPLEHAVICFDFNDSGCLFQSVNPSGAMMKFKGNQGNNYLYLQQSRSETRIPYANVLYSLMSDNAELVPLTPQSQKIIPYLPLERGKK
ncbi:MAG: hypothetical protein ACRC10_02400 [Thermoguttaceae bacterium]